MHLDFNLSSDEQFLEATPQSINGTSDEYSIQKNKEQNKCEKICQQLRQCKTLEQKLEIIETIKDESGIIHNTVYCTTVIEILMQWIGECDSTTIWLISTIFNLIKTLNISEEAKEGIIPQLLTFRRKASYDPVVILFNQFICYCLAHINISESNNGNNITKRPREEEEEESPKKQQKTSHAEGGHKYASRSDDIHDDRHAQHHHHHHHTYENQKSKVSININNFYANITPSNSVQVLHSYVQTEYKRHPHYKTYQKEELFVVCVWLYSGSNTRATSSSKTSHNNAKMKAAWKLLEQVVRSGVNLYITEKLITMGRNPDPKQPNEITNSIVINKTNKHLIDHGNCINVLQTHCAKAFNRQPRYRVIIGEEDQQVVQCTIPDVDIPPTKSYIKEEWIAKRDCAVLMCASLIERDGHLLVRSGDLSVGERGMLKK
ncbi:PUT4 [Acrasis kona]|uniref:PUT4 n=1 Tax=Acrasis kona TaxID=1008807 RepID=A0AAW2ZQI2_9EUKA